MTEVVSTVTPSMVDDSGVVSDITNAVGCVLKFLKFNAAAESGCGEYRIGMEIGPVVGSGMWLAAGLANASDAGRAEVLDLLNHLVGQRPFEASDCGLPNLKSLLKNPRF